MSSYRSYALLKMVHFFWPTLYIQRHKIKYSNRNNSAADCSISLKFATEFQHVTSETL